MPIIQVVIAIVLMSAMAATSVSFVSKIGVVERDLEASFSEGFRALELGWREYTRDHRTFKCTVEVPEHLCPGYVVDHPGYLGQTGWRESLFPAYVFEPVLPGSHSLTYSSDADGQYFCSQGNNNTSLLKAAEGLQRKRGIQQVFLGSDCGLTAQGSLPDVNGVLAITYWVNRN